ncbi:hypothetical protein CDO52_06925 [Nocardiopsis gilva YIM 90087]|uniref:Transposase Helix-turn-helix domain-containing protein n=1 Tax=Nocardiopsis gilva YIM 90087 TaxID=1235441 RepID=A0A223S343_9ACTN|nr:hypothetical protein [Nocardiopsis gilva]ASU82552.1 hypothetical protein CDO52_06925 [Nocardiopsis gilva YIM 90087]
MITYRAILDVPREAVHFVAKLLAAERRRRRTPKKSRALTCFHQAILLLRQYHDGTSPATLAGDHGIGRSTDEGSEVPIEMAPALHHTLEAAHLVLDGIVIPNDHCPEKTRGVKGEEIDRGHRPLTGAGIRERPTCTTPTCKASWTPGGSRCSSVMANCGRCTVWPPPASTSCPRCTPWPPRGW